MSKTENMSDNPGVKAGRTRKRRLWIVFLAAVAFGGTIDAVLVTMSRHAPQGGRPVPPVAAVIAAVFVFLLLYCGSWLYWRLADELERQDNLIGFAAGFLFNIGAFALWYVLYLGGLAPRPEAFPLFVSTGVVGFLAYCLMKLRRMR
jgi:hypothetical protein